MKHNKKEVILAGCALLGLMTVFLKLLFGNSSAEFSSLEIALFATVGLVCVALACGLKRNENSERSGQSVLRTVCIFLMCLLLLPVVLPVHAALSGSGDLPDGLTYSSGASTYAWTYANKQLSVDAVDKTNAGSGCDSNTYTGQDDTLTLIATQAGTLSVEVTTLNLGSGGSVKINDVEFNQGDSNSYPLEVDDTVSIYIKSSTNNQAASSATTKLVLTIRYTVSGSNVTLAFQPVENIPYTVTFGESSSKVTDSAVEFSGDPANGISVVADDSHYILTGATLEDGSTISATGGKLLPTVSGKITPIFKYDQDADGIAPFKVGTITYWEWDAAMTAASAGDKLVVLNDDYTLQARADDSSTADVDESIYTVPSGITLLIPYNDTYTVCTTTPTVVDALTTPTVFRTLTMDANANITVEATGAISVAGSHAAAYPKNAQTSDPLGVIKMNSGSNITVKSGGNLYVWGYIAGSGTVTIKSGGTVYEDFQVRDYRGGDVTTTLTSGDNVSTWHIFPMSQYYVQNVQVPMTLEAGAIENCCFSVTASLMGNKTETVPFIGADGMFQITSGYIVKDYEETTDRLIVDVYGTLEVNPFSIAIQVKVFSSDITINSANYDLPLTNHFTINLRNTSEVTLNQDLLILPGAEINIEKDAKLTVGSGKRLIVYDDDQWSWADKDELDGYCSDLKKDVIPLDYVYTDSKIAAPTYTRTIEDLVDSKILVNGTLDASAGYLYTTDGGGNICSTGNGKVIMQTTPAANAYQIAQRRNTSDDFDQNTELDTHPITSAQLLNEVYDEDNELPMYTETAGTADTYYYSTECGRWHADEHAPDPENSHLCVCGAIRRIDIYGTSVKAGDSLGMYFYVEKGALVAASGDTTDGTYYAIVTHKKNDENNTVETSGQLIGNLYEETYYRFYFPGVAAKEMTDELEVTIYWYNGKEYVPVSMDYTESVQKYAMDLLNSISDNTTDDTEKALRTVLVDMLNYGAACQVHHDYNNAAENLANAQLSATQQGYATKIADITYEASASDDTGNLVKHSVSTESSLVYTFFFRTVNEGTTATVTYTDHYGNSRTLKDVPVNYSDSDALYYVDVTGLAVANGAAELTREDDLRKSVDITCTVAVGESQVSVTGSIEAYLKNATASADYKNIPAFKNVIDCLACFATSAYEYFRIVSP